MLRRKLALYTLFYIAGIAAGFFILEKSRILEAAGFSAAVIAAAFFSEPCGSGQVFTHRDQHNGSGNIAKHRSIKQEVLGKQRRMLLMMFLTGIMLFSVRYMHCRSVMSDFQDNNFIRGKAVSVSVRNDRIQMIIRNSGTGAYSSYAPAKVLVTIDDRILDQDCETTDIYAYIGETVEARGEYTDISSSDNPGCFDYSLYMKSRGVPVRFKAYALEVKGGKVSFRSKVRRRLYSSRESFISRFEEDTQGFIRGVIFGDKSGMDGGILEEFNSNSTGHILAVSGLHIGFLYGLLRVLTVRRRTLPVSILIITIILLYGEMTMWSPATVRACIVMTVSLCSTHLRRCSDLLTSVSFAAFLILTYQPYQLFSSGFQLSFLALCGIAFLTGPISPVTGETLAVMVAVQIGTIPVIAYSYCRINPLSIFINVPVILLASVLVPVCILLLMIDIAICRVPAAGIDLAELISYAVIKTNHILNFGGSFTIRTAGPEAAAIVLIYILVFGLASEWTRVMLLRKELKVILRQGILLLMPLAMLFSCLYDNISDDEIVFAAVGQGDCVHIRAADHDVLIDGGGISSGYNVGKGILMPYLMHAGADSIDIALVTHLHADHYKGITELSDVFPVGAIGIPADYRDLSASGNETDPLNGSDGHLPKEIYIGPDTKIDISDGVYIETIWPVKETARPYAADDPNEHNAVYMIHYKDIKVMVTGDMQGTDERDMVEYYDGTDTLSCDILKVAHHGSRSSSCEEFLDAARPRIAVIQCGRNNFYGHPHRQTLDRLEKRGIQVFRTDISGAVGIDIHGSRLYVDLFRKMQ